MKIKDKIKILREVYQNPNTPNSVKNKIQEKIELLENMKDIHEDRVSVGDLKYMADGGMMAKGGMTPKEQMLKELQKLQRDLNSHRLQTYIEGDTSEEQMARFKEREVKLKRFNEILEKLQESEKMADGGMMDDKYKYGGEVKYFLVKYSNQPSTLIKASSKDEAWRKYSDSMRPVYGTLSKSRAKITQEMAMGGRTSRSSGRAWTLDQNHYNKSENYEVPMANRKRRRLK